MQEFNIKCLSTNKILFKNNNIIETEGNKIILNNDTKFIKNTTHNGVLICKKIRNISGSNQLKDDDNIVIVNHEKISMTKEDLIIRLPKNPLHGQNIIIKNQILSKNTSHNYIKIICGNTNHRIDFSGSLILEGNNSQYDIQNEGVNIMFDKNFGLGGMWYNII